MYKENYWLVLLVVVFVVSSLTACTTYMTHSKPGTETTIILTRHAEKTFITNELTDKGRLRAKALAKVLGDKKVTAIYCPDVTRNLDTARPLSKAINVDITVVNSMPYPEKVVETMLTQNPGGVVLWVGNTSNLPEIYSQLGGEGEAPNNYGDLFIMNIKDRGKPEIIKSYYETR